jgi:uncharacterized protein YjlB
MGEVISPSNIFSKIITENDPFPNNSQLPLIIYKKVLTITNSHDIETLFQQHRWKRAWVNGIYPFHHYHSNIHEVLGVSSGRCTVQIGGEGGDSFQLEQGDVMVIPAGVSHKNLKSSSDFSCVGAYPFDHPYDMNYGREEEIQRAKESIKQVPLPDTDPIFGVKGPLFQYWTL